MDLSSILQWLGTWTGIISTIITSTGVIFIAFKKIMKKLQPHLQILENLQKLTETVNSISKEFRPNGGASVRDTLNSLSKDVKSNMDMTKRIGNIQLWQIDSNPSPVFYTNDDGEASYVNQSYCTLLKRSKEELLGNGWKNCLVQEKRQEIIDDWKTCVKEKRAFERFLKIEDKNGKQYTVKVIATRTDSGEYLGIWTQIHESQSV